MTEFVPLTNPIVLANSLPFLVELDPTELASKLDLSHKVKSPTVCLSVCLCAAKKLPKTDPAASSTAGGQQQRGVNLRGDEAPPSTTGCCNWAHPHWHILVNHGVTRGFHPMHRNGPGCYLSSSASGGFSFFGGGERLVGQGLTSHSTQFRSFRRRCFYRSDDPTNSVKALKEGG